MLGAHPTPEQVKAMSLETGAGAQTPAVFLVQAVTRAAPRNGCATMS
jgi:hypothetical protein